MPAAVAQAAIGAGASLGVGLLNRSSANSATRAQQQANAQQLAYLKEQADRQDRMAREQWDAEQARRAPFRAAAAQLLSSVTGQPADSYGGSGTGSGGSGWTRTAADPTIDRSQLEQQIRNEFTSRNLPVNEGDVRYFADKASTPDIYSDGNVRVGWNPYLAARMINKSAAEDPSLAGTAGIVGKQTAGGGGSVNPLGHIDYTSARPTGGAAMNGATNGSLVTGAAGMTIKDMLSRRY